MMDYISITAPQTVEILRKPRPKIQDGQALVKLISGGICGSDVGTYQGTFAYSSFPCIPGHELAVEIVEIAENSKGLNPGSLATINPYYNCGTCRACQTGKVNCCEFNETMGVQREGGFAQFLAVPIERLVSGKDLPARTLALVEPACIAYHGIKRAQLSQDDCALVIGAGTIGMMGALLLKHLGIETYIADNSEAKLMFAQRYDLSGYLLNQNRNEFLAVVREVTSGNGFDVVFEVVGKPATFEASVDSASFGGKVVLIGISKETLDFNFTMIQKKELDVLGSRNAMTTDLEEMVEMLSHKELDFSGLISKIYPYREASDAFAYLADNQGNVMKVLLDF